MIDIIDMDSFKKEQEKIYTFYYGSLGNERSEEIVQKLRRFMVEMQPPINRKNKPSFVKEAWQVNSDELPF